MTTRDAVPDHAKLYFAGILAPQARSADGLQAVLSEYFDVPIRIEQYVGHWMALPPSERSRIGPASTSARLGHNAVAGARVWDRQHKFRIWIGPLDYAQYRSFLPGGDNITRLVDWVRFYLHGELDWDVRLVLKRAQAQPARLGSARAGESFNRLGWTTWVLPASDTGGPRARRDDLGDVIFDADRWIRGAARRAQAGERG